MSSKAENSYVFKLDFPLGHIPTPTEISVYARVTWLERYCSLSDLDAEWAKLVEWKQHVTAFMEWFVDLSSKQRDELAPRFEHYFCKFRRELWTGWLYEDGCLIYKSIPRENPAFTEYSGETPSDIDWADPEAWGGELPYLDRFEVTNNVWFNIAWRAAFNYIESGIVARAALNSGVSEFLDRQNNNEACCSGDDDYDIDSPYRDIDFDKPHVGWHFTLNAQWHVFPLKAIKWFLSLTEDQRSLYAPRWVSNSSVPGHKFVTYYDQGQIHRRILLPDADPRAQNGSTW